MVTINKNKIPIKIWAEQEDIINFSNAIDQASNLANHPLCQKWVALMPDFHVGFGMPIGGVIATKGGVIPNAVGVDIGCGMIATQTSLNTQLLDKASLQKIRLEIHKRVPVGTAGHAQRQNHPWLSDDNVKNNNLFFDPVVGKQKVREEADRQIGSLGGGNHFIEIQKDQDDQIWIMLHSGSRGFGHKICEYYHKQAVEFCEKYHSAIPTKELAFLPVDTDDYRGYMLAMNFAMVYAEENRKAMYKAVKEAFEACGFKYQELQQFDTHHNFAAMENHYGENLMIHRKGAVKASGLVTIPGSMGTASYICKGLEPKESFNSCSHGAGRVMGRRQANEAITHEEAVEAMKDVVFGVKQGDYDEMPAAYKDIEKVIKYQKDLVKPMYKLTPLAVAKG